MNRFTTSSMPLAAALSLTAAPGVSAMPVTQVVALTGDAAPDGNGVLSTIESRPALNDLGQVAFLSGLTGTSGGTDDDLGAFRGGTGGLVQVARKGQAVPDGNGFFFRMEDTPWINEAGQVAFDVDLSSAVGGPNDIRDSHYRGDGTTLVKIARPGDPAPDGNGNIPVSFAGITGEVFNDAGQVGMRVLFENTSGGTADDRGIYLGSGGALTRIVRKDQAAPDGNGVVSAIQGVAVNNTGLAAAGVSYTGTSGGSADDQAILLGNGTTLTTLVRKGDAAPDGNGAISGFNDFGFNDAGQIGFISDLTGTSGGGTDDRAVFRTDGSPGGLARITREGEAAPDGNGVFSNLGQVAFNNVGEALFNGSLTGTSGGTSDDFGLFRGDGTTLTRVYREGQAAPDGNGTFQSNFGHALNDAGQAAVWVDFLGTTGGASDNEAIVFFDDTLGLFQVVREGDSLLGSTVVDLGLAPGVEASGDEGSGLNERGQVAYRFTLADGREGVALWAVPEPGSAALLGLGGVALLARRQPGRAGVA